MIDVGTLRALRSVAALGTLARAADELGFTASAVSQQIKRLERQLGVPVLAQAGRGVVLTPAGQAIVDSAHEVFQALERCAQAARSVSEGAPRGVLRVVAFSTAIRGLLAPAVVSLSARHPDLRVEITEQDPDQALHRVDAGTADLALVHDADGLPVLPPSSLTRRHVHTDVGDVVVDRAHPLARLDRPLTGADLAGHAWVTSPPGTVCHQWFRRLVADLPEEPDVRHLVDDFATQLSLVATGGVLALIPRLARPPLGEGLVSRPLRRRPTREVHAAWRRSADASPALRAVLAELAPEERDPAPDPR
ncbi:LysR substrate-binding domain-containing protein [Umezawaea sp. Da 62-37]|uniref:LysR family transcriptional regulator n=1 Tax=Umezawaea sp. Da 62-37 TaxID=3075927 RepID=UPI0028F6E0D6|nr:LysR substrate-binding domain-containing protein [Umezawaea sp. Da 62-37]WNV86335.1 LysR substrate-binding domain-containing protein [Umezawaea sp. Da 62-37]